jgi:CBS domain-containing protein
MLRTYIESNLEFIRDNPNRLRAVVEIVRATFADTAALSPFSGNLGAQARVGLYHLPLMHKEGVMYVRDAMTTVVLTVGPEHTLSEAAGRMIARGVGAAVVIDHEQAGPGIMTERDILRSVGSDEAPDEERVRDHLTADAIVATPGWSLEQAASEMIRGGFRHIIVVDGPDVVGILSMRDIVRTWTADAATSELAAGAELR